jgi:hypothetical protein
MPVTLFVVWRIAKSEPEKSVEVRPLSRINLGDVGVPQLERRKFSQRSGSPRVHLSHRTLKAF